MAVIVILKTGDPLFLRGDNLPEASALHRAGFLSTRSFNNGECLVRTSEISAVYQVPDAIVERMMSGRKIVGAN